MLSLIFCFSFGCNHQNKTKIVSPTENRVQVSEIAVNINSASLTELEKLPQIGEQTAKEIIEHREKFGRFRKPEFLMLVRGISDERFRELQGSIRVE